MYKNGLSTNKPGFVIVEALLSVAIFAIILTGISGLYFYSNLSIDNVGKRQNASDLNEECIDAVRNIRDAAFSLLVNGTYSLSTVSNFWSLLVSYPETIGIYQRQVQISQIDTYRKQLTCTTSWPNMFGTNSTMSLTTLLTDWARIIVDYTNWDTPVVESSVNIAGNTSGVELDVKGNYAYVVTSAVTDNFVVIDISNSAAPTVVATRTLDNILTYISIMGNYAYVTSSSNTAELVIMDISDPLNPTSVSTLNLSGNSNANAVQISGSYAYVVRNTGSSLSIAVVNISNPASPSVTSTINFSSAINDIFINGMYAYAVTSSNSEELQIWDISNPFAIVKTGTLNLPGSQSAISVHGFGNYIAVGQIGGLVSLIDISNKSLPSTISSVNASAVSANDLFMSSDTNLLFVAEAVAAQEFKVWDISSISSPVFLGGFNTTAALNGLKYVFATNKVYAVGSANTQEFLIFQPQ